MKIVDEAPVIHRAEPMPARSASHAGTWLAQLERVWLDRWNAAGEGASSASQRPAADSDAWDAPLPGPPPRVTPSLGRGLRRQHAAW